MMDSTKEYHDVAQQEEKHLQEEKRIKVIIISQ